MRNIASIDELNSALLPYVPLVAQLTGKDTVLDRIRPLMQLLGDPQDDLRTIHIAGTSGKTSTSYFIAALLQQSGKNVGLTVSPHIDSVTERVQINGRPLDDDTFCKLFNEFMDIVDASTIRPSYFELLYAFSIWTFKKLQVDYAVVETGLGGLHDATNVINRADKVCVITDIGLDHMHVLGDTIEQIALQKAGIIHPGNTVFMYQQNDTVMRVFTDYIAEQQAELRVVPDTHGKSKIAAKNGRVMPRYQQRNWQLAYQVCCYVQQRDSLTELTTDQLARTQTVQVPARMDIRHIGDKTIIMDGAHNDQKMTAFLDSFIASYPNEKPAIMIALKHDKRLDKLGPLLASIASRIITTTFETSQDLPVKSVNPLELQAMFISAGVKDTVVILNQHEAYQTMLNGPEKICIITGSFYLISQLRQLESLK